MNPAIEFALRSFLMGVGATLVIDVWAAILKRFGVPSLKLAFLNARTDTEKAKKEEELEKLKRGD